MKFRRHDLPTPAAFSVYRTAVAAVSSGVGITFDTVEFGAHLVDSAQGRFRPRGSGLWLLTVSVSPDGVLAADNYWSAQLRKNGVGFRTGNQIYQRAVAATPYSQLVVLVQVRAGEYYEAAVSTNNGSTALRSGRDNSFQGVQVG